MRIIIIVFLLQMWFNICKFPHNMKFTHTHTHRQSKQTIGKIFVFCFVGQCPKTYLLCKWWQPKHFPLMKRGSRRGITRGRLVVAVVVALVVQLCEHVILETRKRAPQPAGSAMCEHGKHFSQKLTRLFSFSFSLSLSLFVSHARLKSHRHFAFAQLKCIIEVLCRPEKFAYK